MTGHICEGEGWGGIRGGGGDGGVDGGRLALALPGLVSPQLVAVVGGRLPQLSYLSVLPQHGAPLPLGLVLHAFETTNLSFLRLEPAKVLASVEVLGHVIITSLTGGLV